MRILAAVCVIGGVFAMENGIFFMEPPYAEIAVVGGVCAIVVGALLCKLYWED